MRRWRVKHDGGDAGHVYADTVQAARRAARAAYKRIHPDREPEGRVHVPGDGEEVSSEPREARRLVSEVYEGLRLLPGMESPAEKLRSALLLLESAVARDHVDGLAGSSGAPGGGDSELADALEGVLGAEAVPSALKSRLRGLLEWVGVDTPEAERRKVELSLFRSLWEGGLVDLRFEEKPGCRLYQASAFLLRRLTRAGVLRVERFEGARDAEQFRSALEPYGSDAASLSWGFVPDGGQRAEPVEVRRPLVLVGDRVLQPAQLMRGVPIDDEEAVALDRALYDALDRLGVWKDGLGRLAEPYFEEKQRQLFERTEKRIHTTRRQMAEAAQEDGEVLPPDTARRDLVKFVIDQVHRIEDALACRLPDRSLRDAFGEIVFRDVVFRGAGAYLSHRFGIHIDTEVVEGADTESLVGRFKKEPGGPRPKQRTPRIHSVVVPCYTQDGAAIRPASVRLGIY